MNWLILFLLLFRLLLVEVREYNIAFVSMDTPENSRLRILLIFV